MAAAQTQLIQAQEATEVARSNLGRFVGLEPGQIEVAAVNLMQLPPERNLAPQNTAADPLALEQNATVNQLIAQLKILERNIENSVAHSGVTGRVSAFPQRLHTRESCGLCRAGAGNGDGSLAPGMYPTVKWPVHHRRSALVVPKTSVVTTTERTFVIRDLKGNAEWVDVKRGASEGDLVEVLGNLNVGDKVVRRATDEIRPGTRLRTE